MRIRAALAIAAICTASVANSAGNEIPCECRDTYGNLHDVGTQMCLTVGGRAFMALCSMSQNVTIWRDTGSPCVTG